MIKSIEKWQFITFRVTEGEKRAISANAKAAHMKISEFLRTVGLGVDVSFSLQLRPTRPSGRNRVVVDAIDDRIGSPRPTRQHTQDSKRIQAA